MGNRRASNRQGTLGVNNDGISMIITDYRNANDIDVMFLPSRYEVKGTTYANFEKGSIKCKSCIEKINNIVGQNVSIIRVDSADDVTVRFDDIDVTVTGVNINSIRSGKIAANVGGKIENTSLEYKYRN